MNIELLDIIMFATAKYNAADENLNTFRSHRVIAFHT